MAGEDFFLKFGSNSDEFARNVREDVTQARRQIDLLTRAVNELEAATRSSSGATNLIAGIREDLRGMSSGLARELGQELRTALQRELSSLNINVGATISDPDARPSTREQRPSAANTPEADRLAAQAQRQMGSSVDNLRNNLDRLSRVMGEQESKLRANFERMNAQQQGALGRLFAVLDSFQSRINAVRADPRADVDAGLEAQELARLSSDVSEAIQNSLRTGMLQLSRDLQMRIAAVTGEHREAPERPGPSSATAREEARQVEIDPSVVQDMLRAGSEQLQAAEALQEGVGKFDVQVDRFAAAIANMRVAGGAATGAEAATDARQMQQATDKIADVAEKAAQPPAPAPTSHDVYGDTDTAKRVGIAAGQLVRISKEFTPEHSTRQIMEEGGPRISKLSEAFGGDMESVRRVIDDFQQSGRTAKEARTLVDQEMEVLRAASRRAAEATQEVAQANTQTAQARREETAVARAASEASEEVGRAERNAANARNAEARAAASAASETVGTPAAPAARSTEELNREVNRRLQRQRDLQAIITGEYASGGAFDADQEAVPAEARAAASEEARLRREQAGIGTVDRQRLFEEAFEQMVPSNIEGEARERLRGVFLNVNDEAVNEARKYLNRVSSAGVPAVSHGAMQAMFSQIVDDQGARDFGAQSDAAVTSDADTQRWRRWTRAMQLLPVLDQGPGSVEAATRGGSLAALNERLRGVGFEGEVASRAEGADVLNRLRTDFNNLLGTMTGRDRQDFARLAEMPEEERRASAERLRSAAGELMQAATMIQAAIRSGAIQPPTGTARHPDILERTYGEGAGEAGDPRRRRIAEMTDVVRMSEARDVFEATAVAQQFQAMAPSLEEVEGIATEDARQGRVKRMALESLDAADAAIADRYRDLVPEDRSPEIQAAIDRVDERSRRAVEDERVLSRKMEVSALRGEGAQERTERINRGGLQSLARHVEVPEEALRAGVERGLRYLQPLSSPAGINRQDELVRQFGRNEFTGNLISTYDKLVEQATELNRQQLLRREAHSALTTADAFRDEGLPVDERQVAAAQRIRDRTETVEQDLQNTLRQLFVPGAMEGENIQQVLAGKSLADFIYGPTREGRMADEGEDPRFTRMLAARQAAEVEARASGIQDEERIASLREAAGRAAERQYDAEVAQAQSRERTMRGFADERAALEQSAGAWLRGGDPEAAAQAAAERRGALERAEERARPFLGREDDIRAAARGVATPQQLGSLVEALGGFDEAVRRIAAQRGAGPVRTDESIADTLKEDLRMAPERLLAAETRLGQRRNEIVRRREAVEHAQMDVDTSPDDETRRHAAARLEAAEKRLRNAEGAAQYQERQIERQREMVARRNDAIESARQRSTSSEQIHGQVRGELEGVLRSTSRDVPGQGAVLGDLQSVAQRLSENQMPEAIAELRALLRQVAKAAGGVSTEEAERVTSVDQLLARIQQLTGSVEENTGVTQANTSAEQQNTAATQQEAAASGRAGGRAARPTFDLPGTEEGILQTRAWLTDQTRTAPGFSRGRETLFERAREYEGMHPDEGPQGQVSTIRNMLARLAGRGFEDYGKEAQATTTGRARIDDRLIQGAEAGVQQTLAAIGQMDLGDAERRVAEQNYPAQIISTLTKLEGTMSELIVCCKAMQRAARGMGGGGSEAADVTAERLARQAAAGPRVAEQITGELGRRVVESLGRSEVARRGGDEVGSRRALSEAAMEIMADPNMSALKPGDVVAGVQTLADRLNESLQVTGVEPRRLGESERQALRADVDAATRVRGMGDDATFEAFRRGDVEGTAEAMVRATGDVDGAMRELVQIFSLDSEAADTLRASLTALQQQLVATNQSAQQRAEAERAAAAGPEPERARMIREDTGRALSEFYDPTAPVQENAVRVAQDLAERDPSMSLKRVLANLEASFGTLDEATDRLVAAKVQETQASQRQKMTDDARAAASQRIASVESLLPTADRARFRESIGAGARGAEPTITPQEVMDRVSGATGGQVKGSNTVRTAFAELFDTGDISKRAAASTVDQYVQSAQASLMQYRTPFQQFLGELWSGKGFASSVTRTMGNFVSRYVGGAIVFGLAAQFRELTSQALETEQTFIRITAALDATSKSAQGVRSELQNIAVETNTNISDTYEVMAQLVGVFETTEEALQATRVIGQLELISQGALSAREGFRALSAVVSTWQETLMEERGLDQTGAITYVADLATRIQDLTGVNIEDTTEGLARLGETAKALGIEMELIATAVGVTAKTSGQTGQAASEQIGRILANFQNAGTTDVLVGMGITDAATVRAGDFNQVLTDLFENYSTLSSAQQRQVANLIGDPRQFALTNALLSNGAEALDVYGKSLNSAGAAAERQDEILGTLRGQIGQLGKEVQVLVQNLIDLGILNVFGLLIRGASLFLDPLNSILDILNNLKDASPFTKILVDLGLTIAGFKLLMGLMGGALSQMTRMAGLGEVTGVRSAITMGREMFRPGAGALDEVSPAMQTAQRAREAAEGTTATTGRTRRRWRQLAPETVMLGPEPGTARRVARQRFNASRRWLNEGRFSPGPWVNNTRPGRFVAGGGIGRSARGLGGRAARSFTAATGGMGRFVSSLGMATLGMSLLIDAMQKGTQELHDFADSLAEEREQSKQEQRPGETEEDTRSRNINENLREARNLGWWDRMGESSRHMFSSPGNFLGRLAPVVSGINIPGLATDPTDAMAGELPEELQTSMDQAFQDTLGVRDEGGTVEDAAALRQRLMNMDTSGLSTAAQKLEFEKQLQGQLRLLDTVTDNIVAANAGVAGAADFTAAQIEELMGSYQFLTSIGPDAMARYGEAISAMLNSSQMNLPDEAKAALSAISGSSSYTERLTAQADAMELAYEQALLELEQAEAEGDAEKIDAATQALEQIVSTRAQIDNEIMEAALSLPQQMADLHMRTGNYEAAQRELSSALQEARRQANSAERGSPEHLAAIEAQMDILRASSEASIAEEMAALQMAAIGERDPLAGIGNQLAQARLQLQTAIDNPGAYTPDEIRGFMQEIAQLQQQAGDEQEAIAEAMTALAIEQERNPIRQAHLEYAAALDAYNRALEQGLGAQEVIRRAQDVESTARAVRERNEELRSATAEARIAGMPQGDEVGISMAELAEAYNRQANVIREFGRDSAEFQDSIAEVTEARRSVQDTVNAVFDATTDLAVALAEAAGLDIEASRIQTDAALANLDRAVEEAGGNMQAASVRTAMAEAISSQANLRDTVLGEALDTISFLQDMGDITANQAIGALNEILNTMDLTQDQRRDIMRQIQGLQESMRDALSGGFNVADVRIPTPYEVRRSLGVDAITEGVEEGRAAMQDAWDAANVDTSGTAGGGGILDQVLGADLAAEVRSVGEGVGNLLPPLSEVPRIIDETVASREAVVAELRSNLNATVAVKEAQNASIGQLGAVISVPAQLIADATATTRDYAILSKEALDLANSYLANLPEQTGGIIGAINSLPVGISQALMAALEAEQQRRTALMYERYMPEEDQGYMGMRGPVPGRAIGGPVSAYQAYKVGEYGEELFVPNTSGYIVKASDFAPMRFNDPATGGGSVVNNKMSVSVEVTAQTNADANEIARTVERRISNSLRRSMGANQSTPHMVRMR